MKISDIMSFINSFAPFDTQAQWDNSGLLAGNADGTLTRAIVSLDVTESEIEAAEKMKAQLIISHHPLIFNPIKTILKGDICYSVISSGVSVISAHTNLDKAPGGVNDTLCEKLGIKYEKLPEATAEGFLNTGIIEGISTAAALASHIKEKLGATVQYFDCGKPVELIGVCSGAGAEFVPDAALSGCTAYITGDADYHDFLEAAEKGVSLFAAGHFETENIIVPALVKRLSEKFPDVEFIASSRTAPIITVN